MAECPGRGTRWLGAIAGLTAAVFLGTGGSAAKPARSLPIASPAGASIQQIQYVEQAFAQSVAQSGIAAGFRQFAAPDAVMFLPDPVQAVPELSGKRWPGELQWRAQYIGVAPSGDLAFSAGVSLLRGSGRPSGGSYLTVWKRQPDGSWKFVLDHAADMPAGVWSMTSRPPVALDAEATGQPANEGMREADGALNVALPRGGPMAFADRLDEQTLLIRANRPVVQGRRRALALLSDSPAILEALTLGGSRSADGNFGYTYGRARWSGAGGPRLGYYVRIWRATPQGWRLLADQLAER